jgi:hypothetical protein
VHLPEDPVSLMQFLEREDPEFVATVRTIIKNAPPG